MSSEYGHMIFCVADDLASYNPKYFIKLAESLTPSFKFDYGYVYRRRLNLGADLYAVGISSGLSYSIKINLKLHQ